MNKAMHGMSSPSHTQIERRLQRIDLTDGADSDIHESEILELKGPLVIVGDPGAGKSVLMESLEGKGGAVFVRAARLVRMDNPAKRLGTISRLVVDGIDEVASNVAGGGVEEVLKRLSELNYPDFILSCRAADWRGAADRIKIKDDYGRDAKILALKPFDRGDAEQFLQTRFPSLDGAAVLAHLEQHRLHEIYGNPLTLRFFGEVAMDGDALPESRGELLGRVCPKLIQEANDRHKDKDHARLDPEALMLSAGAASAAILLCDKLGIFNGAIADLSSAFFSLASLEQLPFTAELRGAIKTRLFKSEGENLFAPVHRVVTEYLGARWLAKCVSSGQSARRIILLLRQGGLVPTSLRALNAWLAGFSPELSLRCIADDPYGVLRYGDVAGLPLPSARALLHALVTLSHKDPYFRAEDWSRQSTRGLARLELKDDLLNLLKLSEEHQLLGGLLIDALNGTELGAVLKDELRSILLDPIRPYPQRARALDALVEGGAVTDWSALLKSLANLGDGVSLRIAANTAIHRAVDDITAEEAIPILLSYIGLTICPVGTWTIMRNHNTIYAGELLLKQPTVVLETWLDTISDYGSMLGQQVQRRRSLVDFALALLARRLEHLPPPSSKQLGRWTRWLWGQSGYDDEKHAKIRDFFVKNLVMRRDLQAEVLLSGDAKALMRLIFPSGGLSLGLSPDEEDYAALLRAWHKREEETGPNTEMWETLLQMGRSREGLSPSVREAAEETARGKTERFQIIEHFDQPIAPWRDPDHEKWLAERVAKRDDLFISHRAQIEKYLTDIDAGSAVLAEVADAYRGRFVEVNDLSGEVQDKMAQFLTPRLAQRVLAGFIASLSRTDLPSARQISECHIQHTRYPIEGVLIAGIAEMLRLNQPLSKVPQANLESAFMAWRRDPASNTEDPLGVEVGLAKTILDTPEAYERFYRTSIEPQLEANSEHICDLYDLTHKALLWSKPWMVSIAARLSREWLARFPMLRATTVGDLLTPLLANSLADIRELVHVSRARVCKDIDTLFFWLGVDFIADFEACKAHLLDAAADNPDFLWILRVVVEPPVGLRLSDMSVEQLEFIIRAFSPHWPFTTRPDQTIYGHTNPWDASDFITKCIAALSAIPTTGAATSLALLVDTIDFGYKDELKHASSQQRCVQADHDYCPADLDTLKAAATGALPATVDDLRAFFGDRLTVIQSQLNGDNLDSWVVYWDRDHPHNENYCRNRFINQVSGELPAAITFGPEEQMPGITRADIGLRLEKLVLPIEIKGQWHSDVWAAASEQLDGQYTRDWRADRRGVYLVLWFGDVPEYNLPLHPEKIAAPETPDHLRSMLIERIPPERRSFIDIYVLDVSGTAEGRARLAVGRQRKRSVPTAKSGTQGGRDQTDCCSPRSGR